MAESHVDFVSCVCWYPCLIYTDLIFGHRYHFFQTALCCASVLIATLGVFFKYWFRNLNSWQTRIMSRGSVAFRCASFM